MQSGAGNAGQNAPGDISQSACNCGAQVVTQKITLWAYARVAGVSRRISRFRVGEVCRQLAWWCSEERLAPAREAPRPL